MRPRTTRRCCGGHGCGPTWERSTARRSGGPCRRRRRSCGPTDGSRRRRRGRRGGEERGALGGASAGGGGGFTPRPAPNAGAAVHVRALPSLAADLNALLTAARSLVLPAARPAFLGTGAFGG